MTLEEIGASVGISPEQARAFMRAIAMLPSAERPSFLAFVKALDSAPYTDLTAILAEAHRALTRELSAEIRRLREAHQ